MKSTSKRIPSVREVLILGTPVLREKAKKVSKIDDSIKNLIEDMLVTMRSRNGIGLAAQQVGETAAVCVIDITRDNAEPRTDEAEIKMPLIMINPEIIETSGTASCEEGCLSIPDIYVTIQRAVEVTAVFQDLGGKRSSIRAKGLLARAVQHELDHLNGVLLVDRMSPIKRISLSGKLKKLKKSATDRLAGQKDN